MTTFNLGPPYQDSCRDVWPQPLKEGTLEGAVKVRFDLSDDLGL